MNTLLWVEKLEAIVFESEVATHDFIAGAITEKYLRVAYKTNIEQFDASSESITRLEAEANVLIHRKKQEIDQTIREILDEKFSK